MKKLSRFSRDMLVLVSVLVISLTPMLSFAVCVQDDIGEIFNFNVNPVNGEVAGTQSVAGVYEWPGTCSQSPLSGSLVENTSEMEFELGITAYPNDECGGIIVNFSGTIDATTLDGEGHITAQLPDDTNEAGSIMFFIPVTMSACGTGALSSTSTRNASVKDPRSRLKLLLRRPPKPSAE